jgi:hypothetical protein
METIMVLITSGAGDRFLLRLPMASMLSWTH